MYYVLLVYNMYIVTNIYTIPVHAVTMNIYISIYHNIVRYHLYL
nr:MAG TPA: hypothetical protein [Caudoviricetes sp.]DAZ84000.1 MAG TPA: hypothetical protein [Caudoviricetes sp.]